MVITSKIEIPHSQDVFSGPVGCIWSLSTCSFLSSVSLSPDRSLLYTWLFTFLKIPPRLSCVTPVPLGYTQMDGDLVAKHKLGFWERCVIADSFFFFKRHSLRWFTVTSNIWNVHLLEVRCSVSEVRTGKDDLIGCLH